MNRPAAAQALPEGLPVAADSHLARFFETLSQDLRDEVNALARVRTVTAGTRVIAEGEEPHEIGYIVDGMLCMKKVLPDGRAHIIGLLVPTDMYGRVFDGTTSYDIEALTDATLYCFDRKKFEGVLARSPQLERMFMVNILDELDAAREWILLLGGRKVVERVASFLLILARRRIRDQDSGSARPPREIAVHVPVSRRDLAQYLGTRPESLSRALHELERKGLIRLVDAYHIAFRDMAGLVEVAGHDLTSGGF